MLSRWPNEIKALLGIIGFLEALGRSAEIADQFNEFPLGEDPRIAALGAMYRARSNGQFAEALRELDGATGVLPEGTEAQLRGELGDRAGDEQGAIAAFTAMNRADAMATPHWAEGVRRYRAMLDATLADNVRGRPKSACPETRRPPFFLLGFPRSGTTLLDTFLMGHPDVEVHEERPYLDAAAAFTDASEARVAYWRALDREVERPSSVQIDKYPLATARAPLINAMFPTARYFFALRHPCDVVLSCFMTRFRLNWGVSAFLPLDDAADTYDRVMTIWTRTRERSDLDVQEVRYEALIARPEEVLREATDFAGVGFERTMLDHRVTARTRGMISTPSHAQVVEQLYGRAAGRWRRYREFLEPVLSRLAPWCERFGYDLS
ncbi:MAG: sulfotransferase [Sphingomonadales bacterium]|nr:sulfotransferase [Sphingomonadales bacterium]